MNQLIFRNDLLAELFAQAPAFIASFWGPDHSIDYINPAFQKLIGDREVMGKLAREALPELVFEGSVDVLDRVRAEGSPWRVERRRIALRQKHGADYADVVVDLVYQPVRDPDGAIVGIFLAGQNVTEQVDAQERADALQMQLMRNSKQSGMDSMGAMLAHELNQPLTVIVNALRAARNFMDKPSPANIELAADALTEIERAAMRAGALIRRLRDTVSRGHVRNRPENLAEIVRDAIDLTANARSQYRIDCYAEVAPDIVVLADRIQLQQVFLNLINNAVEALADRPARSIEIVGTTDGGFAWIDVADTGPGLGAETAARIFEPMFTTKSKGLGLGLSICRAIVEAHGGTIALKGSSDRGTTLRVGIPCTAQAPVQNDHSRL